ncbi:uncharacterized protein EI90DRAFT_3052036 [Cantharellus anzutake]|uniref:uncharacterized protein n=1 Tax=Cantharellus anzutake TaxID=1750568 RepID=UPI001908F430|nr:uncharacterized protein EI90DRAFT_3052036 [Cantharellus anzutake]KAF8333440.1 hypothetical protein EI90DRAFT_3052036 [Cantharellus anzutake]
MRFLVLSSLSFTLFSTSTAFPSLLRVFLDLQFSPSQKTLEAPAEFPEGWRDPKIGGGSMIDIATKTLGEPLNVIVSAKSHDYVLTDWGFRNYMRSLGYNEECMKQHRGGHQQANLGDGFGYHPQQLLFRQHYFPILGTCWESLAGGQHFRGWKQNGTEANTGAWFLAVSKEKYLGEGHLIVDDGYNKGRDWLVEKAVAGSRYQGRWWKADVEWKEGLLKPGLEGINHNISQDGVVAVLTVKQL